MEPGGEVAREERTYDANRNVETVTAPEGQVTAYGWDARDLLASVTRGAGTAESVTESYGYDVEGNRATFTNARGVSRTTLYDGFGRVREAVDALGGRSAMVYDDASNVVETRSYDASGALLSRGGSSFDRLNRRVAQRAYLWSEGEAAREIVSRREYDGAGNVVRAIDPLGRVTRYGYDRAGRMVETVDAVGNRFESVLDAAGNVRQAIATEVLPEGGTVEVTSSTSFDALGRPTAVTDALGNTTRTTYL
jgi:YD repeat-containing protein